MKSWLLPASLCAVCLLCGPRGVRAQAPAAVAEPAAPPVADIEVQPEEAYEDFTIKGYTIAVFGGAFMGDEYLNLPVRGARTFEDEGADRIMSYDGEWLIPGTNNFDPAVYDAPIKTIEDASGFGFKIAAWLNENVHVDLVFSYVGTEAVLTMINKTPDTPALDDTFREEISRDSSVTVYRAGAALGYELTQFQWLGIHPYVGFGFGGVIASFSAIDDTGELFFNGTFGLSRPVAPNVSVFAQFDLTTFAMARDELQYKERVTLNDARVGVAWFLDVVPAEVRALHEKEVQEAHSRRH